MEIVSRQPTRKGPAETFSGDVWLTPLVANSDPSRLRVSLVRFSPGARSAWHSHSIGQTLVVTEGVGLVQQRGEDAHLIRAGDVVATAAHEEHWHGATADQFMAHFSITEGDANADEPDTSWRRHVSEDEYRAAHE